MTVNAEDLTKVSGTSLQIGLKGLTIDASGVDSTSAVNPYQLILTNSSVSGDFGYGALVIQPNNATPGTTNNGGLLISSNTGSSYGEAEVLLSTGGSPEIEMKAYAVTVTAVDGLTVLTDGGDIDFITNDGTERALQINSSGAVGVGVIGSPNFGTTGQVLTSQSSATAPVWAAPAPGTM